MSATFEPILGMMPTFEIQPVIAPTVEAAINYPDAGTLVKATLGKTVIYGTVAPLHKSVSGLKLTADLLEILVDGTDKYIASNVNLWYKSGWKIELTPQAAKPTGVAK